MNSSATVKFVKVKVFKERFVQSFWLAVHGILDMLRSFSQYKAFKPISYHSNAQLSSRGVTQFKQ